MNTDPVNSDSDDIALLSTNEPMNELPKKQGH